MSQEADLELRNKGLVRKDPILTPEFPYSSEAIFAEAIGYIPNPKYGLQRTYATTGVAIHLAASNRDLAISLVEQVRSEVLNFEPERTKVNCLNDILYFEQNLGLAGANETADQVCDVLNSGGIPFDKVNQYWGGLYRLVARKSIDEALELIQKHFPGSNLIGGPSTIAIEVVFAHLKFNPSDTERAGEVISQLFSSIDWRNIIDIPEDFRFRPERIPAKDIAKEYGWLVARHGDIRLAEQMIRVLNIDDPERIAIMAELGAREPGTEHERQYLDSAKQLLDRENVDNKIAARLAFVLEKVDPVLAEQFRQKIDLLEVGIASKTVEQILTSGNLMEASEIVRAVIEEDLKDTTIYPSTEPKRYLEKMLVRLARENPQRVVALVDDNFKPTRKTYEADISELKIDILVAGGVSLIGAGHTKEAKELLSRALVIARSLPLGYKPDEVSDVKKRIKAYNLAKIAAAVAKLEEVSVGL